MQGQPRRQDDELVERESMREHGADLVQRPTPPARSHHSGTDRTGRAHDSLPGSQGTSSTAAGPGSSDGWGQSGRSSGTSSPSRRGEHPQGRVSDDGHGLQPSSCLWMDRSAMPQETCAVLARRSGAPPVCTESHHQLPARRTTGCASEPAERIVGAHRIGLTVAFQLTRDPPAAAHRTPDTAHHVHREPAGTQRHQPQPGEFRSIRRGCDRALRPRLSLLG